MNTSIVALCCFLSSAAPTRHHIRLFDNASSCEKEREVREKQFGPDRCVCQLADYTCDQEPP